MDTQYTYTHDCHHIAYGPILSNPLIYLPLLTSTRPDPTPILQKFHVTLPFACSFCAHPNLHTDVPAGSGVLVISKSAASGNYESESSSFSSSTGSSSEEELESTLTPTSSTSSLSAPQTSFPKTWTILRTCNVEEILTSEWAQGISISISNSISHQSIPEHGITDPWGSRRQSFGPQEGKWTPMAWIPRPIGNVAVVSDGTGDMIEIHRSWRGNSGEDASGYGWREKVLAESRLVGMMSELGAHLKRREGEGIGSGSGSGRRMRGLRL